LQVSKNIGSAFGPRRLVIIPSDTTSSLIYDTFLYICLTTPFYGPLSRTTYVSRYQKKQHALLQQQPFYGPLSGTTQVSRYQKKHSPTHHPDHHPIFISFFHLPRSIASSLFKLRAGQSFCTTSFHVLFGLPLGLEYLIFHAFLHPSKVKTK